VSLGLIEGIKGKQADKKHAEQVRTVAKKDKKEDGITVEHYALGIMSSIEAVKAISGISSADPPRLKGAGRWMKGATADGKLRTLD
jgi:hypothetical protein